MRHLRRGESNPPIRHLPGRMDFTIRRPGGCRTWRNEFAVRLHLAEAPPQIARGVNRRADGAWPQSPRGMDARSDCQTAPKQSSAFARQILNSRPHPDPLLTRIRDLAPRRLERSPHRRRRRRTAAVFACLRDRILDKIPETPNKKPTLCSITYFLPSQT